MRHQQQEPGFILDEQERARYLAKIEPLIHDVTLIMECVDSETLDQWGREQYNRLKLEQECKD